MIYFTYMDYRKKNTDLTKVLNKSHENKWVALSLDQTKVLGVSEKLITLKTQIGDRKAVYMKVLSSDISYAF